MRNIPKLRINKIIAVNGVNARIEAGEEIRDELSRVETINNQEKFQSVQDEYHAWDAQNLALLKQYYYERIDVPVIDREEQSLSENKRSLKKAVENRMDWLKRLLA
ncbi:MAG: hypothetical protein L0312_29465 [Acidobacteria bacterium]|nr:hypothetical protein [Acidobacteriota bacterium]